MITMHTYELVLFNDCDLELLDLLQGLALGCSMNRIDPSYEIITRLLVLILRHGSIRKM